MAQKTFKVNSFFLNNYCSIIDSFHDSTTKVPKKRTTYSVKLRGNYNMIISLKTCLYNEGPKEWII